ncbi:DUF1909-domain-containing protein [Trematosphaeria pertusa]|uniref:DUF1909-domain-containing protein n=1 Tax=Trematosphaeria pertusa TaxID=390896 RepID=A0A6A6IPQ6_9PLEO|nr:DUF1909-domain-containing protein [Trematosphaeria pertusa]KAF2251782.1 DUF1909-domain-containing protein [Trematosphaeria pertusa]
MGNGNRAQQKRERNAAKAKGGEAKSQLKSNAAALTIKCKTCFQSFQSTTNRKMLSEHATNKHSKAFEDCFDADAGVAR